MQKRVKRLYANTRPFYKKDLNIHGFWFPKGPRTSAPWVLTVDSTQLCGCFIGGNMFI
jgi:hypothetical protein